MEFRGYLLHQLALQQAESDRPYLEFLRVPSMSVGLYVLPAGGEDKQLPHSEDEVYYVVEGRSRFMAGQMHVDVEPGAVLFVAKEVEHRFYDISETMRILVFFAPAEYSLAQKA